jgi:hypothetical protein
MIFFATNISIKIYIPQSLRQQTKSNILVPWIFTSSGDRLEQKRLSRISWHGLVLHKMLNIDCLFSTCQVCQMTKKEHKKYGLLPPKIAESDIVFLGHGLCGSGGSMYTTIRTPAKSHSLLTLTMIDPATGWFEIVKATNKSEVSIQDLFHKTGWHVTHDLNILVFDNGIMYGQIQMWVQTNVYARQLWH